MDENYRALRALSGVPSMPVAEGDEAGLEVDSCFAAAFVHGSE
jgi:hypothetical protein